jgi:hypothetical protein
MNDDSMKAYRKKQRNIDKVYLLIVLAATLLAWRFLPGWLA